MSIYVESYLQSTGEMRVLVCHSAQGKPFNGEPGARTTMLSHHDAKELHRQLTIALTGPKPCHDCGSDLHGAGSPSCREERECED